MQHSPTTLLLALAALLASPCLAMLPSQLPAPPAFRGGRVRPVDQMAMASAVQRQDSAAQRKPAASSSTASTSNASSARYASSVSSASASKGNGGSNSFMPMSPSAALGIGSHHKSPVKQVLATAKKRTSATARNINVASSMRNSFVFPASVEKSTTPIPALSKSYNHYPVTENRNASGRFFSFNTNRQALDLGLSFTVPFLSIPMSSLVNLGTSTSSALATALDVNWPSILAIGAALLAATFVLPTLIEWVSAVFLVKNTAATYGYNTVPTGYGAYRDNHDEQYARSFKVSPMASLLEQLDDALAQYDLDATSCMQRTVCSYVADAEDSISRGDTEPSHLIINGLARSSWITTIFGQSSFSKAVEVGRSGSSCKKRYPGCPFSLAGVLKFLASYASFVK